MQKYYHLSHNNSGPLLESTSDPLLATHAIRRECMTHQHHMVNVQKSFFHLQKNIIENYVIAYLPALKFLQLKEK